MKRLQTLLTTTSILFALALTGCGESTNPNVDANATAPPPPPADMAKMFMKPEKGAKKKEVAPKPAAAPDAAPKTDDAAPPSQ